MKKSILLIGANDRAMLSMAKQGSILGYDIDGADILDFPFQYSKFIREYYKLPDYRRDARSFVDALIKLCAENKYDAAILIHDDMLELYMKNRKIIDQTVNIICPPTDQQYELSHNKYSLIRYCEKLSFKSPKSQLISSITELEGIIKGIKFPVIAKPVSTAILIDNHLVTLNVKKAHSAETLIDFVREHINNTPIMLQEIIGGNGAGANFIAKDGKIIEQYIHLREREAFGGGVSSLRKITGDNYLGLFDLIDEFVASTKWSGLGMMEFKIQNDVPYLMELNARPWGSIEAGVVGGYNIPQKFLLNFYEEKKQPETTIKSQNDIEVLNSKLDLQYSLSEMQRGKTIKPLFRWMYDALLNGNIKVEDSIIGDFRFNSYNHLSIVINAVKKRLKKLSGRANAPIISKERLQSKKKIGFVCFGNICRTPFAKIYAEKYSGTFSFSSYGLYTEPNRFSPINAVLAAQSLGITIEGHRSEVLTDQVCEEVDALLFMDELTYGQASDLFARYRSKMYKIQEVDIADPYGSDAANFKTTYSAIADRIDKLFK
jgi:protein-tyrosine-phosphatase/predicted ATP-grasp superfamily ATP-dependent carboligase